MEIRTPVLALKGPRPGPLDDGGKQNLPSCEASGLDFTISARHGQAIQAGFLGIWANKSTCLRLNNRTGLSILSKGIKLAVRIAS